MLAKVRGTHPLLPVVALQKLNLHLRNFLHAQQEQTIQCRVKMLMFQVALLHLSHGRRVCWVSTSTSKVALINQTLETMTEFCQYESNELDIITALLLTDINPLGQRRMDLVREVKNNAPKMLL